MHDHSYDRALLKGAEFAACAFNLPREEVTNFFNWRQQDAIRNSIQMTGSNGFSNPLVKVWNARPSIWMITGVREIRRVSGTDL